MRVSWNKFDVHNDDKTDAFEAFSNYIFCKRIGVKVTNAPKNYPGLEAKPVKDKAGKCYGLQAKFFTGQSASQQEAQIVESLKAIKDEDLGKLDVVQVFVNEAASGVQAKVVTKWQKHLSDKGVTRKITIEWFAGILSFQTELESSDYYSNIKAFFFGGGSPTNFQKDNVSAEAIQLFGKSYCIDLPMTDNDGKTNVQKIIKSKTKTILVRARAGAGKSKLLDKIAYEACGLNLEYKEQIKLLLEHGIVIKLSANDCANAQVRDVMAARLSAYGVGFTDYPICLLLDSLDEVTEKVTRSIASDVKHLLSTDRIQRAVLCSRRASKNAVIIDSELKPELVNIEQLNEAAVLDYFKKRRSAAKTKLLTDAIKSKRDISALKDVRMLELAWEVVENEDGFSKENLLEKKYEAQLAHDDLGSLNLLDPKSEGISAILESQAYKLQLRENYDFGIDETQHITNTLYPKLSYTDTNNIINKLCEICLDKKGERTELLQFEHRSWADYFAARYLVKRFIANKILLAKLAHYEDFLREWFVAVGRHYFISRNELVPAIAIGIIETYLDDEASGRTSVQDELTIKIGIAKYHAGIREQVDAELEMTSNARIAALCLDAGFEDTARAIHDRVIEGLDANDKGVHSTTWDSLPSFYKLRLAFEQQKPKDIFSRTQKMIHRAVKNQGGSYYSNELRDKLTGVLTALRESDLELNYMLSKIMPEIAPMYFEFLIEPTVAREIISNPDLVAELLKKYNDDSEISLALQGIFASTFSETQKELAKKYIDDLREKDSSRYTDPFPYQTKIYAYKRILGYSEWEESPYKREPNGILTLERVFEVLYYWSVIRFKPDDLEDLCQWIGDDLHYIYGSRNYDATLRKAITVLIAELLTQVPYGSAKRLLDTIKKPSSKIYSSYLLPVYVYKRNENRFKGLFSYQAIAEIINSSNESLDDLQSTASDYAQLLAVYEPEQALTLLYELKKQTRLRYGYHKDLLGFFLTDALEVMWSKSLFPQNVLEKMTTDIYELIIKIDKITDGKEVRWLPDYFFKILTQYDLPLAEKLHEKYTEYEPEDSLVLTIMLKARIARGDPYDEVVRSLNGYRPYYLEPGRIIDTYYEERFIVLTELANQKLYYTEMQRRDALMLASSQIKSLRKQDERYAPTNHDNDFVEHGALYRRLKKELDVTDAESFPRARKSNGSEFFQSKEYKSHKRDETTQTKKTLKEAGSREDLIKLIEQFRGTGVDYRYLLSDPEGVKIFIDKLLLYDVPFSELDSMFVETLTWWYYGRESKRFAVELWKSAYREDIRKRLATMKHHADVSTVLEMFLEDEDYVLAKELITETIECIRLLTRDEPLSLSI